MRILCQTYEFPPVGGGGSVVAESIAEALGAQGHKIDVVTSHYRGLPRHEQRGHLDIYRVPCGRYHLHYSNVLELAALLLPLYRAALRLTRANSYDFSHTHFALPTGLIAHRLWRATGLPYALTLHGSDIPGYNPDRFEFAHVLLRSRWRRVLSDAALVISPSAFLAGLTSRYSDVPIRIIPNGYKPPLAGYPPKRNCILVVTRMFERKGVQFFIEAIRDLSTDWEIIIVGDGPYLPRLKKLAQNVSPGIRFMGHLDRSRLGELYGEARIFVFPSIQENFPIVLLEAMHAGCAIITTDAKGCAEVVGEAGIRAPAGNADAIREALGELMRNPAEVERYASAAATRAKEFEWNRIADRYHDTFEETFADVQASGNSRPHVP